MPVSPAPGRALSVAGLNKTSGWGSRNATGNLIAGHEPDQGINHIQGLSESGLDTAANPLVTTFAVTSITTTGATVTWTSAPASPLGSVTRRALGAATTTTTAETGTPPLTAHSVALSGLTADTVYDLLISQPGSGSGATQGRTDFVVRIRTGPTGMVLDVGSATDGGAAPQRAAAPVPEEAPAFELTALEAYPEGTTSVTLTWRTEAYADGLVHWDDGEGHTGEEWEEGNKRLNHIVLLTGLTPATTYTVTVESSDAGGDTVTGGPITVTTPPAA